MSQKSWPELIGSGNPENGDYAAGIREAMTPSSTPTQEHETMTASTSGNPSNGRELSHSAAPTGEAALAHKLSDITSRFLKTDVCTLGDLDTLEKAVAALRRALHRSRGGEVKNYLPDHLKFGYAHVMEMREIEKTLRATGLSGAELYFSSVREYEERHKNDPSYRELHKRWVATASTPSPPDLLWQALEQIRDGHNDPRSLARETLELIERGEQ